MRENISAAVVGRNETKASRRKVMYFWMVPKHVAPSFFINVHSIMRRRSLDTFAVEPPLFLIFIWQDAKGFFRLAPAQTRLACFTVSACDWSGVKRDRAGVIDEALTADTLEDYEPNSSSNAFASFRSRFIEPSLNHP